MMCVPCYLDKSPVQGLGIFASEAIRKDTLIWQFVEGFDLSFREEEIQRLPERARQILDTYAYHDDNHPGEVMLCSDIGRYMNHSRTPNTYEAKDQTYAARDIEAGEEITCDYRALFAGYANTLPYI